MNHYHILLTMLSKVKLIDRNKTIEIAGLQGYKNSKTVGFPFILRENKKLNGSTPYC